MLSAAVQATRAHYTICYSCGGHLEKFPELGGMLSFEFLGSTSWICLFLNFYNSISYEWFPLSH